MKTWKDVPHLFANGKFQFKYMNSIQTLHGYYKNSCLAWGVIAFAIEDCKLIARPISDMSDDEKKGLHWDYDRVINDPEENLDIFNFTYLLSIGVYPFDQSHFKTGTVIDINTL